ncbi:MAG TPA: hypothetical protein VF773_15340 [Verrucomicrobiae bacterium]
MSRPDLLNSGINIPLNRDDNPTLRAARKASFNKALETLKNRSAGGTISNAAGSGMTFMGLQTETIRQMEKLNGGEESERAWVASKIEKLDSPKGYRQLVDISLLQPAGSFLQLLLKSAANQLAAGRSKTEVIADVLKTNAEIEAEVRTSNDAKDDSDGRHGKNGSYTRAMRKALLNSPHFKKETR